MEAKSNINKNNLFSMNKFVYFIIGMSHWESSIWFRIYNKFILTMLISYVAIEIIDLVIKIDDFNNFIDNVNTTNIQCFALYRHYLLYSKLTEFNKIMDLLEFSSFKMDKTYGVKITESSKRMNAIMIRGLCIMAAFTLVTWCLFPIFSWDIKPYGFPMPIWIPFDLSKNHMYPIVYVYACICSWHISFLVVASDLFMGSIMNYISCQFEILSSALMRIVEDVEDDISTKVTIDTSMDFENHLNFCLKQCIRQHIKLLKTTENLNSILSSCMLSQLVSSALLICVSAFKLAKSFGQSNLLQMLTMLQYLCYTLTELLIICGWGDELTTQSSNISFSIYHSSWYKVKSRDSRKLMQIMMLRAQHPVEMTAAGLYVLSNKSYLMMLKSSYSCLSVLLNVD